MNLLSTNKKRLGVFLTVFAFVVSGLYDFFFWNHRLGLGFFLFVTVYVVGFLILTACLGRLHNKKALLLLIPIFILSLDVLLYNNNFVQYAVPVLVGLLLFFFSTLITLSNPEKLLFRFGHVPLYNSIDLPFTKWGAIGRDLFSERFGDKQRKVIWGVFAALPLLLIFGFLFAKADPIFQDFFTKLFNFDVKLSLVWRIFRTLVHTLFLSSILYVVFDAEHRLVGVIKSIFRLENTIVATVLSLINILFAIFVFIQVKYLFGGTSFVLKSGITFADYARQGFFELALVMAIAATLVVIIYRSLSHHGHSKFLMVLSTLLITQVLVIAISSLRRMGLYQDEYGFTTLRLYVQWFIYLSMFGLVGLAASIIVRVLFHRFIYGLVALGLLATLAVASVDVDSTIAKENINRFILDIKKLDTAYIGTLSLDAAPEVVRLLSHPAVARLSGMQLIDLYYYLEKVKKTENKDDILSWNYGAERARFEAREHVAKRVVDWFKEVTASESNYLDIITLVNNYTSHDCPTNLISNTQDRAVVCRTFYNVEGEKFPVEVALIREVVPGTTEAQISVEFWTVEKFVNTKYNIPENVYHPAGKIKIGTLPLTAHPNTFVLLTSDQLFDFGRYYIAESKFGSREIYLYSFFKKSDGTFGFDRKKVAESKIDSVMPL